MNYLRAIKVIIGRLEIYTYKSLRIRNMELDSMNMINKKGGFYYENISSRII